MNERERLRRDDPERTRPIRSWFNLYRRSDSWDLRDPGASAAGVADSWNEVVAHGVDLGYRVIEEQIAQGRRVAEQVGRRSYDSNAMGNDFREVNERMGRYYGDLMGLWLEFMTSLAGAFAPWAPAPPPAAAPSATPAASGGGAGIMLDVVSARPTQVTLDLHPGTPPLGLHCQALRALEEGKPPLTEVAIERDLNGRPILLVRVPEAQPPGVYVGAVVDRVTGQSRGTLSVQVAESR